MHVCTKRMKVYFQLYKITGELLLVVPTNKYREKDIIQVNRHVPSRRSHADFPSMDTISRTEAVIKATI